jgi:hypothetical protein
MSLVLLGSTSGSVTLQEPAVAGTTTLTLPAVSGTILQSGTTVTEAQGGTGTTTGYYGFKNRIINGAMVIDQRNAGASVTPTNGSYTLDRFWYNATQASKATVQQSSIAPAGFVNSLLVTSSSAYSITSGDVFGIVQRIEGNNVADLGFGTASASTVTVSFWVRSSLTGTFGGSLYNSAADRCYPFSYTINSADTWEQKTVTVAGDTTGTWLTNNGTGLTLYFCLGTGSTYGGTANAWTGSTKLGVTGQTSLVGTSGATFYITGVQLEKGSTATSFDYRPYGTELQLAQRYYCKSFNQATASAQNAGLLGAIYFGQPVAASTTGTITGVRFPVSMRTAPSTITIYNPSAANGQIRAVSGSDWSSTTIAGGATGENGFGIFSTSPAGVGAGAAAAYHFAATSEL